MRRVLVLIPIAVLLLSTSPAEGRQHRADCHHRLAFVTGATLRWQVDYAIGTSCADAVRVFRAVSRWSDPDVPDLDTGRHPSTLGYRCNSRAVGDYSWNMRCTRGSHVIRAAAAL